MADDNKNTDSESDEPIYPPPISSGKRKRLQQAFEHGNKMLSTKNDVDYAAMMFGQCVAGDPENMIYLENFLKVLRQKYNNNKKGSKLASFRSTGAKSQMKKARKDPPGIIKAGVEVLKLNPWDSAALLDMAGACNEMECHETGGAYLKMALDGNPDDMNLQKSAGELFAEMHLYNEAISCYTKANREKPDETLQRRISRWSVEKTIYQGKYETAQSSRDVNPELQKSDADRKGAEEELTPEQRTRNSIRKNPEEMANYIALGNMLFEQERYEEAEKILKQGVEASGGDRRVREKLEDIQLHRVGMQVAVAKQEAEIEKSEKKVKHYRQLKAELNKRELEKFRNRVEAYPSNLFYKYEFGLRLKRAGMFKEAIQQFQSSVGEDKLANQAYLELGESFQHIKQYKLAMSNYEKSIETATSADAEATKLARYRAGKLASGLKEYQTAERHLTKLAEIDFGYKDVAELLDDLQKKKEAGSSQPE